MQILVKNFNSRDRRTIGKIIAVFTTHLSFFLTMVRNFLSNIKNFYIRDSAMRKQKDAMVELLS